MTHEVHDYYRYLERLILLQERGDISENQEDELVEKLDDLWAAMTKAERIAVRQH